MPRTIVALAILLYAAFAQATSAATICYPREQMLSYIARDLQASPLAHGIVRPFSTMEVWVSDRDGDWIIVTTDFEGNSCIVAYGEDFGLSAQAEEAQKS
jgi:hypothetical protein